jgi:uncharacterized protein (DUF58 family)
VNAMWKNFIVSIALLAIAMISALYSSTVASAGHMIRAGTSALLALGIALWVAIRFVPRLASNVDWQWLPFLSRYRVTRDGWMYLGGVAVVMVAAVNTANNLLYMVLSGLLAVLLLSGFLSALNFRSIRIWVRIPSHCFSAAPFPISIQTSNEKRFFPTFSLRLTAVDDGACQFSASYIPMIRALNQVSRTGQAMIKKRGHHQLRQVKVASRYPFAFFLKERNYKVDAECICYPEIIPHEEIDFSVVDFQGTNERFERGLGHDLYTIRDYVPSDSARHVHWKASAKTSALKTREYAAEENHRVVIAFDRFGGQGDEARFEQLVSSAASLAYHLTNDGVEVGFVADDWQSTPGNAHVVVDSILGYLALVTMSDTAERPSGGTVAFSLRGM